MVANKHLTSLSPTLPKTLRYYWQNIAPQVKEQLQGLEKYDKNPAQPHPLDSISLVGKQHQEDESSTAAVGRIIYRRPTSSEPESQEAKMMLSYLVHWAYGIFQGGMYGASRSGSSWWPTDQLWLRIQRRFNGCFERAQL